MQSNEVSEYHKDWVLHKLYELKTMVVEIEPTNVQVEDSDLCASVDKVWMHTQWS